MRNDKQVVALGLRGRRARVRDRWERGEGEGEHTASGRANSVCSSLEVLIISNVRFIFFLIAKNEKKTGCRARARVARKPRVISRNLGGVPSCFVARNMLAILQKKKKKKKKKYAMAGVPTREEELARREAKEDDERFLSQMNAKQLDPAKPSFTYEEVARCWQIVMGESVEGNEEFLREYCVPWFNRERDHMCFFK